MKASWLFLLVVPALGWVGYNLGLPFIAGALNWNVGPYMSIAQAEKLVVSQMETAAEAGQAPSKEKLQGPKRLFSDETESRDLHWEWVPLDDASFTIIGSVNRQTAFVNISKKTRTTPPVWETLWGDR